jgi:hypothetical protein
MAVLKASNHPSELRVLSLQAHSKQKHVTAHLLEPKQTTWPQQIAH